MTPRQLQCCPLWCLNAMRRMGRCRPKNPTPLKEPNVHTVSAAPSCSTSLGVRISQWPLHHQASLSTHFQNRSIFHLLCMILSLGVAQVQILKCGFILSPLPVTVSLAHAQRPPTFGHTAAPGFRALYGCRCLGHRATDGHRSSKMPLTLASLSYVG
jgi:hypothetical protein